MSIEAMVSVTYGPDVQGARNVSQYVVHRVLLALAEHADPHGTGACPSQRAIADSIGIDKRDVANALRTLQEQGRITKTADAIPRQRGTTFTVHLIGDCIDCDDDDSLGWSPPSGNGEHRIEHRVNSLGNSLGDSLGWSPPEPEPDPQRRALSSSVHSRGFAANGDGEEDLERPPDWIGR